MSKKTMYWVISKDKIKVVQVMGYENNGMVTVKTMQGEKLRILREDLMSRSELIQKAIEFANLARELREEAQIYEEDQDLILNAIWTAEHSNEEEAYNDKE